MEEFNYDNLKYLSDYAELQSLFKDIINKIDVKKKYKFECTKTLKTIKDILLDIKDKNLMLSNNDV